MTTLLEMLGWTEAEIAVRNPAKNPPLPPVRIEDDGGDRDKWAREVIAQMDNLLWMIECKRWRSSIHIQKDMCNRLSHIPESFVRQLVKDMGNYKRISRYYVKGS